MLIELLLTATFYAEPFLGRHTASGDIFMAHRFTAAFNPQDFPGLDPKERRRALIQRGTRKVWVVLNDLCPIPGRIDFSPAAAAYLGIRRIGKGKVRVMGLRRNPDACARSPTRK